MRLGLVDRLMGGVILLGATVGTFLFSGCNMPTGREGYTPFFPMNNGGGDTRLLGSGVEAGGILGAATGHISPLAGALVGVGGRYIQNEGIAQSVGNGNSETIQPSSGRVFRTEIGTIWKDFNGNDIVDYGEIYGDPAKICTTNSVYLVCEIASGIMSRNWTVKLTDSEGNIITDWSTTPNVDGYRSVYTSNKPGELKPGSYRVDWWVDGKHAARVPFEVKLPLDKNVSAN